MKKLILALLLCASALHADSLLYTVRLASGKPQERTVTITPGTYMVFDGSGNISLVSSLTGSGAALTSLNASNITSGTLDVARYAWGAKAIPSGVVVGTTDTQTLTGKTLTSPTITGWAGATSITTVGTIGAGTWQGTAIAPTYMTAATTTVNGVSQPASNADLAAKINTLKWITPAGWAYLLTQNQTVSGIWNFAATTFTNVAGSVASQWYSSSSTGGAAIFEHLGRSGTSGGYTRMGGAYANFGTSYGYFSDTNLDLSANGGSGVINLVGAPLITGNVTANGTSNTMPNQTAANGASIMTRDLTFATITGCVPFPTDSFSLAAGSGDISISVNANTWMSGVTAIQNPSTAATWARAYATSFLTAFGENAVTTLDRTFQVSWVGQVPTSANSYVDLLIGALGTETTAGVLGGRGLRVTLGGGSGGNNITLAIHNGTNEGTNTISSPYNVSALRRFAVRWDDATETLSFLGAGYGGPLILLASYQRSTAGQYCAGFALSFVARTTATSPGYHLGTQISNVQTFFTY